MDLACSIFLLSVVLALALAYLVRRIMLGRARHARVDAEGRSALVGKGTMEGFYWVVQPVAILFESLGITANAVTWSSLVLGTAAAVAFAAGHFGLGALIATVGAASDAIDGLIARRSGSAKST